MNSLTRNNNKSEKPLSIKLDQILGWSKSYNVKSVLLTIGWIAFITCWLTLLIDYGQGLLKSTIPAMLIVACISIIKIMEISKK